jgi:hypothetical protein
MVRALPAALMLPTFRMRKRLPMLKKTRRAATR